MGHGSWVYLLFAPTRKVIPPKAQLRRISTSFLYTKQLLKQSHGNGRNRSKDSPQTKFDLVMGSPWFHVHPKVLTASPSKWWKHQGAVEKKSWCKLLMDGRILNWAHAAKWAPRKFHFSFFRWELIWEHIGLAFIRIQLCSKLRTGAISAKNLPKRPFELKQRLSHYITISINSTNIQALYGISLIVKI